LNGRYTEDGHTKGSPEFQPPNPVRLRWELNSQARFGCYFVTQSCHLLSTAGD